MSAAALDALDANGRDVLHRMYCNATICVLIDAVGEQRLRRVMASLLRRDGTVSASIGFEPAHPEVVTSSSSAST